MFKVDESNASGTNAPQWTLSVSTNGGTTWTPVSQDGWGINVYDPAYSNFPGLIDSTIYGMIAGPDGATRRIYYARCTTAANTAVKAVTIQNFTADDLVEGAILLVHFNNANTVKAGVKLQIGNTTAKEIMFNGSNIGAYNDFGNPLSGLCLLVYGGTYWIYASSMDHSYTIADSDTAGLMPKDMYTKLYQLPTNATLASTYAKKSDISSMYKHKGTKATKADLPTSGNTAGDVWNVTAEKGMNYVWTGSEWDAIGEVFTIDSITNDEINTIVAS